MAKQLQYYLNCNNLFPVFQSAYRQNHSTETALLKVMNDILLNMNNQRVTLLIIYIQKFLDSDWLRVMQFLEYTMQK